MEVCEDRQPAPVQLQHCYGNAVHNRQYSGDCNRGYNETVKSHVLILVEKILLAHISPRKRAVFSQNGQTASHQGEMCVTIISPDRHQLS